MKTRPKSTDYIFVGLQLGLMGSYLLDPVFYHFTPHSYLKVVSIAIGILGLLIIGVALLQLNTHLSPFPSPKTGSKLIQNGVYRYMRHPIYTGILCLFGSYAVYTGSVFKICVIGVLVILFYYKSSYEEKRLTQYFKAYPDYKRKAGRFFPRF